MLVCFASHGETKERRMRKFMDVWESSEDPGFWTSRTLIMRWRSWNSGGNSKAARLRHDGTDSKTVILRKRIFPSSVSTQRSNF